MSTTDTTNTREAMREQLAMTVVEIQTGCGRKILGPYRLAEAQRIAEGAHNAGADVSVLSLRRDPAEIDLLPIVFGQWPQRGFSYREVASNYTTADDRFVVSAIVGYGESSDVDSAEEAARAAVDFFTENGDVTVHVYDRETGQMHPVERRHLDEDPTPVTPARAPVDVLSDAALVTITDAGWEEVDRAKAALRPALVEQIARRVRTFCPDATALELDREDGDQDNEPRLKAHEILVAGGEAPAEQTAAANDDRALDEMLCALTSIDGIYVERLEFDEHLAVGAGESRPEQVEMYVCTTNGGDGGYWHTTYVDVPARLSDVAKGAAAEQQLGADLEQANATLRAAGEPEVMVAAFGVYCLSVEPPEGDELERGAGA